MPARLFCKTGPLAGSSYQIADEATIGKASSNKIVLQADVVSGTHARIYFDSERSSFFLEDLNSRNGTRLDGIRVRDKEKLDKLNVITFAGKFDFIFQTAYSFSPVVERKAPPPEKKPPPAPAPEPSSETADKTMANQGPSGLPARLSQPQQETQSQDKTMADSGMRGLPSVLGQIDKQQEKQPPEQKKEQSQQKEDSGEKTMMDSGGGLPAGLPSFGQSKQEKPNINDQKTAAMSNPPSEAETPRRKYQLHVLDSGKKFNLKEGENTVGRSMECVAIINSKSLSRRHALITITTEQIRINDLGSSNHTFVEGRKINAETEITANTKLRFGNVEAIIVEG
jgi:pSer/pThr/pTyr-binding forkhead associated (FHA) protein